MRLILGCTVMNQQILQRQTICRSLFLLEDSSVPVHKTIYQRIKQKQYPTIIMAADTISRGAISVGISPAEIWSEG